MKTLPFTLAMLATFASSPAMATVTYVDSQVYSTALADVYAHTVAAPTSDNQSAYSSSLPVGSLIAESLVDKVANGGLAHAYQSISFTAPSPTSGSFDLAGSISTSLTSPSSATATANIYGSFGTYHFITSTPVLTDFNYQVTGTQNGNAAPDTALDFSLLFDNAGLISKQSLAGSGATQILLQPGNYDIIVSMHSMLDGAPTFINASGTGNLSDTYNASLNFTFAPATPEPASWLLMICGLALTGGIMRRRNRRSLTERPIRLSLAVS